MLSFYRSINPRVRRLLLFFLAATLVINVAAFVALMGAPKKDLPFGKTTLYTTARYLLVFLPGIDVVYDDSWEPMHAAYESSLRTGKGPDYLGLYNERGIKFIYPPVSLMITAPLFKLPYVKATSNTYLNIVSWLAVAATAALVAGIFMRSTERYLGPAFAAGPIDRWALAALAVAATLTFFPVVLSFALGQIQAWLNLIFAGVVMAWLAGRKGLAGGLIMAICLIKANFALFFLWAILRKEWSFVRGMLWVGVPIAALSLVVYGVDAHVEYVRMLIGLAQTGDTYYLNQSFNGFLNRLLTDGPVLQFEYMAAARSNWLVPFNPWVAYGTTLSSLAILLPAFLWRRREHARADLLDFMIAALSFMMATPLAWTHHYGITLPMFAAIVPIVLARQGVGRAAVIALGVAYLLLGNTFEAAIYAAHGPWNFVLSYTLVGGVVLLLLLYRLRHAQYLVHAPDMAAGRPALAT